MNKVIGIMAHVDAGKTTFSEQLLYKCSSIKNIGRVDHRTSHLDRDETEMKKGITIFADQAEFTIGSNRYFLIDTPGHTDFSAETERAVSVLDYGIILIDGSSGVQAHTLTLFRITQQYNIPIFFFINKSDMPNFNSENIISEIKERLTEDIVEIGNINDEGVKEFIAERDEDFLNKYLDENATDQDCENTLGKLIKKRLCFPVMIGSALNDTGISEFIETFDRLTFTEDKSNDVFCGKVYKIRHDEKGNRITFMKALSGSLKVKDEFCFKSDKREKINEIRYYNGEKYQNTNAAYSGELFAVTGIKSALCGDILFLDKENETGTGKYYVNSAVQAKIETAEDTSKCMEILRIIEAEEPSLNVEYHKDTDEILVNAMGKIQLEILEEILERRFNLKLSFGKPTVQYRETIKGSVMCIGHYEPLRHYAEVQFILVENERGKGIEFESKCHIDRLALNYQNLIKSHVFEKKHRGILTGFPITDIKIILNDGISHLKHTEGGDFREATYRAIRQGLEKAENILLEPFYKYEITAENNYIGRILSDIQKMRGNFEPPEQKGNITVIHGRCPVETMFDYNSELLAFTKGNGSISMILDGYDECGISDKIIEEIAYDKGADKENTSCSVFCKKGAGFVVNWYEVDNYAHTLKNR